MFISTSIVAIIPGEILDTNTQILNDIKNLKNKEIIFDGIIGNRQVTYWEHKINDYNIKGDYILIHKDIKTDDIIKYEKQWTTIHNDLSKFKTFFGKSITSLSN